MRELERVKEQEHLEQIPILKKKIEELKEEVEAKNTELNKRMEDGDILRKLYNEGIIDLDGNPTMKE